MKADVLFFIGVLILSGLLTLYGLFDLRSGSITDPLGERGFPVSISALIFFTAAIAIATRWATVLTLDSHPPTESRLVGVYMWTMLLLYAPLLSVTGFFVATSVSVFALYVANVGGGVLYGLFFSITLTIVLYLVFGILLSVQLPVGLVFRELG